MLTWLAVLLGVLVGGWTAALRLFSSRGARLFTAVPLGLGLWLAWTSLVGLLVPWAAIPGAVLAAVSARWSKSRPADFKVRGSELFLLALVGLCLWLFSLASLQLAPDRDFVIGDLPKIALPGSTHPLGEGLSTTHFAVVAGSLQSDPWRTSALLTGLFQLSAFWLFFYGLKRYNRGAPLAAVLGGLFLFLGTTEGFLICRTPAQASLQLLVVAAFTLETLWPLAALAAAPFSLWTTLGLVVARAVVPALPTRPPLPRPVLAVVVAASVVLKGPSLGLLAAVWLLLTHPKKWIKLLAALELLLPFQGVFGLAALGAACGRGLTALWLRSPRARPQILREPHRAVALPIRWLVILAAVVLIWAAIDPGERILNDEVLIGAQKQDADLLRLASPQSLEEWLGWRGQEFGFKEGDLELARAIAAHPGRSAFVAQNLAQSLLSTAFLSSLSGAPLGGWVHLEEGSWPAPALAAFEASGDPAVLQAAPVDRVFQRGQPPLEVPHPPAGESSDRLPKIEPTGSVVPGVPVDFKLGPASGLLGYRVLRNGRPFGAEFGVVLPASQPFPFVLPKIPGEYQLIWFQPDHDREFGSGGLPAYRSPSRPPLEVEFVSLEAELPSASLLPVEVILRNVSDHKVVLPPLKGARLDLKLLAGAEDDLSAPLSAFPLTSLEAGAEFQHHVFLRTPVRVGRYNLELELVGSEGTDLRVTPNEPAVIRTWRRRLDLEPPEPGVQTL